MSPVINIGSEVPRCPVCSRHIGELNSEQGREREDLPTRPAWHWAGPCGCTLTGEQFAAVSKAMRPPWRFDVPEVPASVTAIRDCDGDVWLRTGSRWCLAGDAFDYSGSDIRDVFPHAPLVECPDPRAAS